MLSIRANSSQPPHNSTLTWNRSELLRWLFGPAQTLSTRRVVALEIISSRMILFLLWWFWIQLIILFFYSFFFNNFSFFTNQTSLVNRYRFKSNLNWFSFRFNSTQIHSILRLYSLPWNKSNTFAISVPILKFGSLVILLLLLPIDSFEFKQFSFFSNNANSSSKILFTNLTSWAQTNFLFKFNSVWFNSNLSLQV